LFAGGTEVVITATKGANSVFAGFSGGGCTTSPCTLTLVEETSTTVAATFNLITVTSVVPNEGPTGGGTPVTITGTNLTGATEVVFGGTAATSVTPVSSTEVTATSPAHSAGVVDVTVVTPEGTSAVGAGDKFTYVAAPTVTGLNPTKGPTTGENIVTITGTDLTGVTGVKFGANSATELNSVSSTELKVKAPPGAAGTVDVIVTAVGGTSANTAADDYTYVTAPTVTGLNPNKGPTTGGNVVTITGTDLTGVTGVKFGANSATELNSVSSTELKVKAPAGAAGTVDVIVTAVGGTSANTAADDYTYVTAPTVTSLNPTKGPAAGENLVTITGTGLAEATKVEFGTTGATIEEDTATTIKVKAPVHAAGIVDVTVTTPGGTSATSAASKYTYVAAPVVTSISPTKGPAAGGTPVEITGINLSGATKVEFGATTINSPFEQNTATKIKFKSPPCTGIVDVRVITIGGTSAVVPADQFTCVGSHTLTVTTAGTGSGSVTCNGVACASSYEEGTVVTIAAAAASGSKFDGWSGAGCSGTGNCVVTINADTAVTATFTLETCATNPALCPPPPSPPAGTLKVQGTASYAGGKASLKGSCSAGTAACTGSITLKAKVKQGKKTKTVVIGKASYNVSSGATKTISVKITNGAAKQQLNSGKQLKATLSGGAKGSVTIKPPKKKK
jgi:hypothetical protein